MDAKELIRQYENGRRDFRNINLRYAYLRYTNLKDADLIDTSLQYASLRYANLQGADLRYTNLQYTGFKYANLKGADLRDADLRNTNFQGANLEDTCLDPMNAPNGNVEGFEFIDKDWCIGYRTKNSSYMYVSDYEVGQLREAPIFSTSNTECHPGIYVLPTIEEALEWGYSIVSVIFRPWECHKANNKWRVKWLIVWENM